jgi:hypothetical protein
MPRPRKVVLEVQENEKQSDTQPNTENKPEEKKRRKRKVVEPKGIEIVKGDYIITFQ